MNLIQLPSREESASAPKITAQTLLDRKQSHQPITALTAYDYSTARLVDQAGIDMVLVGDSLGMTVLGYDSTLPVTMEEMLHHTRAVRRAVRRALLVADMPFGSYHSSTEEAVANATRFIKDAGAEAVKIEGGRNRAALVATLTQAEIAVVGHIGLTPQSVHRIGYRVQGKSAAAIDELIADAQALESAGAIAIVLECVPRSRRTDHSRACHSHHRHRRGPGVRRPDSRLTRPRQSHRRNSGQVCSPLCRRVRALHRSHPAVCERRPRLHVPRRCRELPPYPRGQRGTSLSRAVETQPAMNFARFPSFPHKKAERMGHGALQKQ